MKAFIEIIVQWVRPILRLAGNAKLVPILMKGLKLGYDYFQEAEAQRKDGDGQFTKEEKAEWVKNKLREVTGLPDRWIDFIFGLVAARFISEQKAAK